jgi:hypothetical protein
MLWMRAEWSGEKGKKVLTAETWTGEGFSTVLVLSGRPDGHLVKGEFAHRSRERHSFWNWKTRRFDPDPNYNFWVLAFTSVR